MMLAASAHRIGRTPAAGRQALFTPVPEHDRNRQRPGG